MDGTPDTSALFTEGFKRGLIPQNLYDEAQKRGLVTPAADPEPGYTTERGGAPSPRAQALKETITGPEGGGDQSEMLQAQQAIEQRLRAAGKSDAEIEQDPEWQAAAKTMSRAVSGNVTGAAVMGAEPINTAGELAGKGIAAVAKPVLKAVKPAVQPAIDALAEKFPKLSGRAAAEAEKGAQAKAEKLRTDVGGEVASQRTQKEGEIAAAREGAQKEAQGVERQAGEEARAVQDAAAARAKELEGKARQAEQERQQVEQQAAEARKKALQQRIVDYRQAVADRKRLGATTEEAQAGAAEAESRLKQAQQGVDELDHELARMPQAPTDPSGKSTFFGGAIRKIAQKIDDQYTAVRSRAARFGPAIESAGDKPIVSTEDAVGMIDAKIASSANPDLKSMLERVKKELVTPEEGEAASKLTIAKAESLRKYLAKLVVNKAEAVEKGGLANDQDMLTIVKALKKEIERSAGAAHEPYRLALENFAKHSTPLDILTDKAGLKGVLKRKGNFKTNDYEITESDVIGRAIDKAKRGNPIFTRLLAEDPSIKDAARLHFARDLFQDGIPTAEKLATWRTDNEKVLQQLGLYDEFDDLVTAKETVKRIVEEAQGVKDLTAAQVKAAAQKETAARKVEQQAKSVLKTEAQRQKLHPDAVVIKRTIGGREVSTNAKTAAASLDKRAETLRKGAERIQNEGQTKADKALEQGARASEKIRATGETKAEQLASVRKDLDVFASQLRTAQIPEIAAKADLMADSMVKKGLLTTEQYETYLKKVNEVRDAFAKSKQAAEDTARARTRLKRIGLGALAAGGMWQYRRAIMDIF